MKAAVRAMGAQLLLGLYTAFVLQCLWNWFAAPALNAQEVSYPAAYGLNLIPAIFSLVPYHEFYRKRVEERIYTVAEAVSPRDVMDLATAAVKRENENRFDLVGPAAERVFRESGLLVSGWLVHQLIS